MSGWAPPPGVGDGFGGRPSDAAPDATGHPDRPGGRGGPGAPHGTWGPWNRPEDPRDSARTLEEVTGALAEGGAPARLAPAVLAALGPGAADALRADPWRLLEVPGVTPEQADVYARTADAAGWSAGDPRRVRALVLRLLTDAATTGDTAVDAARVLSVLSARGVPDPGEALDDVLAAGDVMVFTDDETDWDDDYETDWDDDYEAGREADYEVARHAGNAGPDGPGAGAADQAGATLLALDRYALAEESVADAVLRLMSTVVPWEEPPEDALEAALADAGAVVYSCAPGEEPPAGLAALVPRAVEAGLRVAVTAPAAGVGDRPGGIGGLPVHAPRDLAAAAGRGPDGTLELDLLVVADAELLDVETAAGVLEALPDGCRVVFAGDPAGLGPAGPGQVFADLRTAGVLPEVASPSRPEGPIAALATGIAEGHLPPVSDPAAHRVVLVPARDAGEAAHRCVQLVCDSIPRAFGIPVEDVLVVTTARSGPAGAPALGAALKARLNPGPGALDGLDPGDRVVRRPATAGPGHSGPGHSGTGHGGHTPGIVEGPAGPGHVTAVFPGASEPVRVPARSLRPAWAMTVGQARGARRPAVVVVLPPDEAGELTRAHVYSAVTRGARHVSVVHAAGPALARAVAEVAAPSRITRLAWILTP